MAGKSNARVAAAQRAAAERMTTAAIRLRATPPPKSGGAGGGPDPLARAEVRDAVAGLLEVLADRGRNTGPGGSGVDVYVWGRATHLADRITSPPLGEGMTGLGALPEGYNNGHR